MAIYGSRDLFQLKKVEWMRSSVEENGERLYGCCGTVGAEIGLHEELLRRSRNGDTTKGAKTKYVQTNSIDFVKRTDNTIQILAGGYFRQSPVRDPPRSKHSQQTRTEPGRTKKRKLTRTP
ncbi:hypothetical protein C8J57DRAFT_1241293 [Mycena rebaudengoi]|nr:hypothetical protein C8J57DRAFT_1241293 [Mycena rebaudengoi]